MAPITRSQAQKRKVSPNVTTNDPEKKIRLSTEDCPKALELLKDLGLNSDFFKSGKASAAALDPKDPAYKNIIKYMNRDKTVMTIKEVTIFKIRTNMKNPPNEHEDDPKNTGKLRKMLWHGTPTVNVGKILEQGLKLPNKKSDPYFGVGIYFSDKFDYSHEYCEGLMEDVSYLFLSDVLLGEIFKSYKLIPYAPKLKVRKPGEKKKKWKTVTVESIQGCARKTPNPKGDRIIDGCVWPLGGLITDQNAPEYQWDILENEYIIYEASRAIPKYLVKVHYEY